MSLTTSISIPAAFLFGLMSFFSPCVLPLVPAYLSYMSGASVEELMGARVGTSLKPIGIRWVLFVLGFSLVFTLMGAAATSVGQLLIARLGIITRVSGILLIVLGLHMLGIFRINALYTEKRFHLRSTSVSGFTAFLIGVTFAFGWTPCIGPTLAAILALAANSSTVGRGIALLAVYSLGLGVPFLIAGFATGSVIRALMRFKKHFRKIEIASGVFIIFIGVLMFIGRFEVLSSALSSWTLRGR